MKRLISIAVFFLVCAPVFSEKAEIKTSNEKITAQKQELNQVQDKTDNNETFLLSVNSGFLFLIAFQARVEKPINKFIGIAYTCEYRYYMYSISTGFEINLYMDGHAPNSFFIGPLAGINWYQFNDNTYGNMVPVPALIDVYYGAHLGYRWIFGGFFLDLAFGYANCYLRAKDYWGREYVDEVGEYNPQINMGWAW
jgi:hypothetical protein